MLAIIHCSWLRYTAVQFSSRYPLDRPGVEVTEVSGLSVQQREELQTKLNTTADKLQGTEMVRNMNKMHFNILIVC